MPGPTIRAIRAAAGTASLRGHGLWRRAAVRTLAVIAVAAVTAAGIGLWRETTSYEWRILGLGTLARVKLFAGVLPRSDQRYEWMEGSIHPASLASIVRDPMIDRIGEIERRIALWHRGNADSQRVAKIPGVGVLTATAVVAAMGDPAAFRSGREFAAWLGLVPRHEGTGGRVRMLGISKRGDRYLRTLLIHGARAVLTTSKAPPEWAVRLAQRRPRPTWSRSRWPTRRRARSGPCWPTTGRTAWTSSANRHSRG